MALKHSFYIMIVVFSRQNLCWIASKNYNAYSIGKITLNHYLWRVSLEYQ